MTDETAASKRGSLPGRWGYRLLTLALLLAVILIEWLVMALLDFTFTLEKKELNVVHAEPLEKLRDTTGKPISPKVFLEIAKPGSISQEEMEEHLRSAYPETFGLLEDPDFPAVRLAVVKPDGEVVFEWEPPNAEEKRTRFNTWKNCLFNRSFEFPARSARIRHLKIVFVNWPGVVEVEKLLFRYRCYAAVFTLGNLVVAIFLYRGAIRPLGRIASALSVSAGEPPPIIPHPRHASERAYNKMARGTRLMTVHSDVSRAWVNLGERGTSHYDDPSMFWIPVLEVIGNGMGYRRVAWIPLEEGRRPIAVPAAGVEERSLPSTDFLRSALGIGENSENVTLESGLFYHSGDVGRPLTAEKVSSADRPLLIGPVMRRDEAVGVLVAEPSAATSGNPNLDLPYFKGLVLQLALILTRTLEREEELDRERFEVSIDLSASMGHDLTNILATGRLELETLRTAYRRGILTVPEDRKKAVEAALEGLRKTVVLLQEVVNVYRAFSFTRKPYFEQVDLNELVAEVIELYRHSTSRNVQYHLIDGDRPAVAFADPRILKLVLFNLLANATHAIAQRQGEEPDLVGRVDIDCRAENDWAVLRATDNGTGFQTPEGQRLEGVELQQIFQFDFTTKKRQGGLGLAWVRSIIEDIHKGRLLPSNRGEERGAVMEVFLPPPPEGKGFTQTA
jgi:signal transduction histidine kinase